MAEENKHEYEGQGLRGPLWTAAGTLIGKTLLDSHGGIGGLFGGFGNANGCAVNEKISSMEAEIARLQAEKYADKNGIEVYKQTRAENQDLQDRLLGNWIKPLAEESAANKVKIATIEAEIAKNKEIVDLKMQLAEQKAATAQAATNGAIFSLQGQVGELLCLTRRHIPAQNVCPLPMARYNFWQAPTEPMPGNDTAVAGVAGK